MSSRPRIGSSRWGSALSIALAISSLLALALAGCDEEALDLPSDRMGVVRGRIHDGGEFDTVRVRVVAESPSMVAPHVRIIARPDDDGRFCFTVPEGPAIVYLDRLDARDVFWRAEGLTPYSYEAERLEIGSGVRDLDFPCGRVRIHVALPPAAVAGIWEVSLLRADDLDCVVAQRTLLGEESLDVEFSLVPPGRYFLQIESPEHSVVFAPATYDTAAAEAVTVRADELTEHASTLEDIATLSGTVTGSWQVLGLNRPSVRVYFDNLQVASTQTDSAGAFSVALLAGGSFRLEVNIEGVRRWIGGDDFASATLFTATPGQQTTGIAHVESGLVCEFSAAGVMPEGSIDIILRSSSRELCDVGFWSDTGFALANLAPGDVYLWIDGWGMTEVWFPQYWDGRENLEDADPIAIPAGGGVAHVTMTLEPGARVLGRLLDLQGEPLETDNLYLMVYAAADSFNIGRLYTNRDFGRRLYDDDTGDYVLTQLRDGQYKMRARAGDTAWTWWPGRACWDSAGTFTIENLADLHDVDWRLQY